MALVAKLFKSSSLQAAIGFGIGGAAFALGNLILARVMPVEEYGRYALAVAIFNIFAMVAPLGFDEASLRHNARLDLRVAGRIILSGAAVSLIALGIAGFFYQLDSGLLALLFAATIAAGMLTVSCAVLRREGHQMTALLINNAANWTVVISGGVCMVLGIHAASFAFTLLGVGVATAAAIGWARALTVQKGSGDPSQRVPLMEALSFVSILAASAVVVQLERLVAPKVLGVEALASFAVLASVALFPYRMLRSGVGFSLVPKLRRAKTVAERNRAIRQEITAVIAVVIVASIVVMAVSPPLTAIITNGKYQLSLLLVGAACLNGAAKVLSGLPRALISACGTSADVRGLNWQSWLMIGFGTAGAWIGGTTFGLAGLVAGAGIGTLLGAAPSAHLAYTVVKRPPQPLTPQDRSAEERLEDATAQADVES